MLEWIGEAVADGGVLERRFDVVHAPGAGAPEVRVPGVLWTPATASGPVPLVLIGHGGAGHKRDDSRLDYAHSYAARGTRGRGHRRAVPRRPSACRARRPDL